MATSDELRAQADRIDRYDALVEEAAAAKAAYRAAPGDPDAKARHRRAAQELNDTRTVMRGERSIVGGDAVREG